MNPVIANEAISVAADFSLCYAHPIRVRLLVILLAVENIERSSLNIYDNIQIYGIGASCIDDGGPIVI